MHMMQWQEFFDGKTFLPGGSSSGPDGAGRLTEGDMYRKRGKRKSGISGKNADDTVPEVFRG